MIAVYVARAQGLLLVIICYYPGGGVEKPVTRTTTFFILVINMVAVYTARGGEKKGYDMI